MRSNGGYEAALRAARAVAALAPQLLARPLATVRENLRLVYGEADPVLVRAMYRHFGEAFVDCVFFDRLFSEERWEEHFSYEGGGLEHFRASGAPAAVFVSGHFGNWELYGASFRFVGIPIVAVGRSPDRRWAARQLERFRCRLGVETLEKANAIPLAMHALRKGTCVAFLSDQAAGKHGIPIPFLGVPAHTFLAPAALAAKFGLPLYAGYSTRLGDGIRYRCWAEPVPQATTVEETTLRLNGILSSYVRAHPEQWWWFHRRFKPPRAERRGLALTPAGRPVSR